nr:MAG TPA: hypothetical protein [Caudoviricetes sp.]
MYYLLCTQTKEKWTAIHANSQVSPITYTTKTNIN